MKYNPINFSKQLIKGRVVEVIFEQMLRDAGCFTILAFGYENTLPELMRRQRDINSEQTMDIIRRAPDFAVINNETHDVHLIEVKYRKHITKENVLKIAETMFESWKPSYLFIATQEGFYFGKVADIVRQGGLISPLVHKNIPSKLQNDYLLLLKNFIKINEGTLDDELLEI